MRWFVPGGPGQLFVMRISPRLACFLYCFETDSVRFCCERCR